MYGHDQENGYLLPLKEFAFGSDTISFLTSGMLHSKSSPYKEAIDTNLMHLFEIGLTDRADPDLTSNPEKKFLFSPKKQDTNCNKIPYSELRLEFGKSAAGGRMPDVNIVTIEFLEYPFLFLIGGLVVAFMVFTVEYLQKYVSKCRLLQVLLSRDEIFR